MSQAEQSETATARRLTSAMVAIVVVLITVGLAASKWYHVGNFGVVSRGVLYRSAQPSRRGVALLAQRRGIKTIVNLRPPTEKAEVGWYQAERDAARRHGIVVIDLPVKAGVIPTDQDVRAFLDICRDSDNYPILVHCEAGAVRTGFLVGVFRMQLDGWTFEQTMREMLHHRFRPHYTKHVNRLRGYQPAPAVSSQPVSDRPSAPPSG